MRTQYLIRDFSYDYCRQRSRQEQERQGFTRNGTICGKRASAGYFALDDSLVPSTPTRPIDIQVELERVTDDASHPPLESSLEAPILLKVHCSNGGESDKLRLLESSS